MKKNRLTAMVVFCLLMALVLLQLPNTANAAVFNAGNLKYDDSQHATLIISGNGPMDDYSKTGVVGMYNQPWEPYRYETEEVIIKSGVTSIGDYAFAGFNELESVIIPSSVTSIGKSAFAGTNLKSVTIYNTVTTIGEYAFSGCDALTSVKLSGRLEVIEDGLFSSCSSLKSVTIPSSVKTIKAGAFSGCEKLSAVTIPNSVTTIEDFAFSECTSLKTVSIGSGVTTMGTNAFGGCTALTKFTVNSKNSTFSSDSSGGLYNKDKTVLLNVPQHMSGKYTPDAAVTTIAPGAFSYCDALTQVHLGKNVTEIGELAFYDCPAITAYSVDPENPVCFADERGVLFCDGVLVVAPKNLSGEYRIPKGVSAIGKYAFYECEELVSVILGKDVTFVGSDSFDCCRNLTTMSIPKNISFEYDNFYDCKSMKDVYYRGTRAEWDAVNRYKFPDKRLIPYLHVMDAPPVGDMDDDWMLSTDDAVYLLLSVMFGTEDYPVPAGTNLDFNGDSEVDTNDAVYLLLHVMFGTEDYPISA